MNQRAAISKINKAGILLVFPIKNSKEPDSLWHQFFPRKKMIWEWDEDGEEGLANLWHLMKRLSDCRKVIYSKWYQGRATFFSIELFTALLALQNAEAPRTPLSETAQTILETLEMDSPLSTKEIKIRTELRGKFNEPLYNKAMKELFRRFLIVAFGEVDDGAFPSLAVGATRTLFEGIWKDSQKLGAKEAGEILDKYMPEGSKFRGFWS
jgi:hypothetical protein